MRSPYERVFAHRNRWVDYRGLQKVQSQVGIRALTFNRKRVMTLGFEDIDRLGFEDINSIPAQGKY